MVLCNLRHRDFKEPVNVILNGERIAGIAAAGKDDGQPAIHFDNAMVFPGLINSHDHLDFNLFPNLGNRTYANYREWAAFIHQYHQSEIREVMAIPQFLRTQWGIYKNLLCGVTTVVNHGQPLYIAEELINVVQPANNLHSVGFEKRWQLKLNHPLRAKTPYVIHTGEGTDNSAYREINQLLKWNLAGKKLIGVHGISMTPEQANRFSALVWCPVSNHYMFSASADVQQLKDHTTILFGTDSTLTAHWDMWEHLRAARSAGELADGELFAAVTRAAAAVWKLNSGHIAPGRDSDVIVVRCKTDGQFYSNFYGLTPEDILLVTSRGRIRLFDEEVFDQLNRLNLAHNFSRVGVKGAVKYVAGNLPALLKQAAFYHPKVSFPVTAA